jgi:hypothetical protein
MRKYNEQKPRGDLGTQSRSPRTGREGVDWVIWLRTEKSGGKRLRHTHTKLVYRLAGSRCNSLKNALLGSGVPNSTSHGPNGNCHIRAHSTPLQAVTGTTIKHTIKDTAQY